MALCSEAVSQARRTEWKEEEEERRRGGTGLAGHPRVGRGEN